MNYWNMQLHPNNLGWTRERELLEKYHLIGLGDGNEAQQSFQNTMQPGDYVLVKHGGEIIALTKVIGNSIYDANVNDLKWFEICREVEILDWYKNEYGFKVTNRKALERYNESNKTEQLLSIKKWINMINSKSIIKENKDLLTTNYNLILTGAPGTGKTYLAKQIAAQMILDGNEDEETKKNKMGEQCGFVQFHPSYDYTDFVEGLRPVQDDGGNVGFERKDGVFKEFCKKALLANSNIDDNVTIKQEFDSAWDKLLNEVRTNLAIGKLTRIGIWDYGLSSVNSLKYTSTTAPSKYTFTINKNNVYDAYRGLQARPSGYFQKYIEDVVTYMNEKHGLKKYEVPQKKITDGKTPSYVFIIDEINRGEISKIFGELFFSIDPGYRGADGKVRTQYANMQTEPNEFDAVLKITDTNNCGHFFVPENVYIIGTMNDIDRSVESMDFAFRRRFAFKEIKAEDSIQMLDSEDAWGKDENDNSRRPDQAVIETIKSKMNAINNVICYEAKDGEKEDEKSIDGLSSAYHIGASYFLKLANYRNESGEYVEKSFTDLWDNHLEGLLREYIRGMQDVEDKIKTLKEVYNNPKATNTDDSGENQ